jgi:hypothetical protein
MEENKETVVEEVVEETTEDMEVQTTFNQDSLEVLVEEGVVENEYKD